MKILLIGFGKMGKVIEKTATQRGHSIANRIDVENLEAWKKIEAKDVDIAIEFTEPSSAYNNINWCLDKGIPVVSGTTGWLQQFEQVVEKCKAVNGSFFYASNYSIGVNLFLHFNKLVAEVMNQYPDYEIEMQEVHHTEKKDSPSGTAISLAKLILEKLEHKSEWVNHAKAEPNQLPIMSYRQDAVPGTHIVQYRSPEDCIELKHIAHSRHGFASGAVQAAEFLYGKKGVFGMKDLLGF